AVAVNVLESEPIRYAVRGVAGTFRATSAHPYAFEKTSSWSCTIPIATLGSSRSATRAASHLSRTARRAATDGSSESVAAGAESAQRRTRTPASVRCIRSPFGARTITSGGQRELGGREEARQVGRRRRRQLETPARD